MTWPRTPCVPCVGEMSAVHARCYGSREGRRVSLHKANNDSTRGSSRKSVRIRPLRLCCSHTQLYTLSASSTSPILSTALSGRLAPAIFGSRILGCGVSSLSLGVAPAHSGLAASRPCRVNRSRATSPTPLVSRKNACFVKQYADWACLVSRYCSPFSLDVPVAEIACALVTAIRSATRRRRLTPR